jgi:hypothetical protein
MDNPLDPIANDPDAIDFDGAGLGPEPLGFEDAPGLDAPDFDPGPAPGFPGFGDVEIIQDFADDFQDVDEADVLDGVEEADGQNDEDIPHEGDPDVPPQGDAIVLDEPELIEPEVVEPNGDAQEAEQEPDPVEPTEEAQESPSTPTGDADAPLETENAPADGDLATPIEPDLDENAIEADLGENSESTGEEPMLFGDSEAELNTISELVASDDLDAVVDYLDENNVTATIVDINIEVLVGTEVIICDGGPVDAVPEVAAPAAPPPEQVAPPEDTADPAEVAEPAVPVDVASPELTTEETTTPGDTPAEDPNAPGPSPMEPADAPRSTPADVSPSAIPNDATPPPSMGTPPAVDLVSLSPTGEPMPETPGQPGSGPEAPGTSMPGQIEDTGLPTAGSPSADMADVAPAEVPGGLTPQSPVVCTIDAIDQTAGTMSVGVAGERIEVPLVEVDAELARSPQGVAVELSSSGFDHLGAIALTAAAVTILPIGLSRLIMSRRSRPADTSLPPPPAPIA